jgi:hypothetical protein
LGCEPADKPPKQHGMSFISKNLPGCGHYQALREMLASANKAANPIERSSSGSFPVLRIVYGSKANIDRTASSAFPFSSLPRTSPRGRPARSHRCVHLLWSKVATTIERTQG